MTVPGQALKVVVSFGSAFLAAFLLFFLSGLALDEARLSEFWAPGAYSNASSVLFVIAHPDDESLFFSSVLSSRLAGQSHRLLCLSSGNHDGLGELRRQELVRSCAAFGIAEADCLIVDKPDLQDDPTIVWPSSAISREVDKLRKKSNFDLIVTFDEYGVSGHLNHGAIPKALRGARLHGEGNLSKQSTPICSLISTNIVVKYLSIASLPAIVTKASLRRSAKSDGLFVNTLTGYKKARRSFSAHESQYRWFRTLFVVFSRYMWFAEFDCNDSTVDYAVKIRVNAAQTGVETTGVKHSMNPFDEIAVEEAVRMRERMKDAIEKITVVSLGPSKTLDVIRTALAMGADEGIHVELKDEKLDGASMEPLSIAKCLKAVVDKESPDMIIMGKQAIDDDSSQVGGMLAGLLSWPQANFASKVDLDAQGKTITVAREIDGGLETLSMPLPAIITTDLRLNEPRYASLPNIMKAKKKPVKKMSPSDLGVDMKPRLQFVKVEAPPTRQGGGKVESVDEIVSKLKEAGAI